MLVYVREITNRGFLFASELDPADPNAEQIPVYVHTSSYSGAIEFDALRVYDVLEVRSFEPSRHNNNNRLRASECYFVERPVSVPFRGRVALHRTDAGYALIESDELRVMAHEKTFSDYPQTRRSLTFSRLQMGDVVSGEMITNPATGKPYLIQAACV